MEEEQLTRREKKKLKKQESEKSTISAPSINIKRFIPWLVVIAIIGGGLFYLFRPAPPTDQPQEQVVMGQTVMSETDHIKGNRDSGVIIYEYSDFQCPACAYYETILRDVFSQKSDSFALVYRNFPLSQIHKNADVAAYAAEAAANQDKFWEMHDKLFDNQDAWAESRNPKDEFKKYAEEIGLDIDQFESDMNSNEVKTRVDYDYVSAVSLKLDSTPTFILDDKKITFRDATELIQIIESKAGENQ